MSSRPSRPPRRECLGSFRAQAPAVDLRPGEVSLGTTSSRESRLERLYRNERVPRRVGMTGRPEHEHPYRLYAGVDWGAEAHQVCVRQADASMGQRSFEHSGRGLAGLVDWLSELAEGHPERVAVAIEIPRGAIVDTLLERGFSVFAINPKQLDRFRDRHTVAGAKDDRRDALVLADSLRTDLAAFRPLQPEDPLVIQLREMTRANEDLKQEFVRLTNRLRDQLHRFYPQVLRMVPAADEPWLWHLLDVAPTPAQAMSLRTARVERLLRAHRIRRLKAAEVLAELRAPSLRVAPGVAEAAASHIQLLLAGLRLVCVQRRQCEQSITALMGELGSREESTTKEKREHCDLEILQSLPGVGSFVAATMLAEASQLLAKRDYNALRLHAGVAPVTRQSGKRFTVVIRRACNPHLREALFQWARTAIQNDPKRRALYDALRQRGHKHARALRGVGDRLLRLLITLLQSGALYDPSRR